MGRRHHCRVDERAVAQRLRTTVCRGRLDDRLRPFQVLLRGEVGPFDDGELAGVDGRAAQEAQGAAVGAGRRQARQVTGVGVDGLGRGWQARRPGRDDHPGARPVQARVVAYGEVGLEVRLAQGDAVQRGMGLGDGEGVLDAQGRFQQGVQRMGRGLRDPADLVG